MEQVLPSTCKAIPRKKIRSHDQIHLSRLLTPETVPFLFISVYFQVVLVSLYL